MKLLKSTLKSEQRDLDDNNVQLDTIGDISALPSDVQDQLNKTKQFLSKNSGLKLVLALNYGGRQEIIQAFEKLAKEGHKQFNEKLVSEKLYTSKWGDPDLVIRTSGEFRVSNFLLWQIAYAEMVITPTLWPDFRRKQFYEAIIEYQSRDRRFGAVR